jgi:type 1 glutamine amidotransferase
MKAILTPLLLVTSIAAAASAAPEPVDPFEIDRKGYRLPQVPSDAEIKIKAVIPEKPPARPLAKRKLLVIWELGIYRESGPYGTMLLHTMGEETGAYRAEIEQTSPHRRESTKAAAMNKLVNKDIKQYDAVVFMNFAGAEASEKYEQVLVDFVKSGKGLVLLNTGINAFSMCGHKDMIGMIGGRGGFRAGGHGANWATLGGKFKRTIRVEAPGNPVNAAFKKKELEMGLFAPRITTPFDKKDKTILLSLKMEGFKQTDKRYRDSTAVLGEDFHPIAWVKKFGKGRVFYSGFGHEVKDYQDPAVVKHILAGIQYALGDLKAEGGETAR